MLLEARIMEWIKSILEKYKKEDGTFDLVGAEKEINAEFPKNAVPKEVYNQTAGDLKTANGLIETLQTQNKDVETLQTQVSDYQQQVTSLQAERAEDAKNFKIREALQTAGAQDVDYLAFKLGDVEVDKEGNIKDLDNKIKGLQEASPNLFTPAEPEGNKLGLEGFKVLGNDLKGGSSAKAFTHEQMKAMSPDEINDNWEAIQASLQGGNE